MFVKCHVWRQNSDAKLFFRENKTKFFKTFFVTHIFGNVTLFRNYLINRCL